MKQHSILLVDDERNILKSLRRIFEEDCYVLHTAESAEAGLKILEHEDMDLIISDQKMGGMNGLEFLEKTVEQYPYIIRILLTGHGELQDAIRAINSGCIYKFILKPWDNDDLKITVKRALEVRDLLLANTDLTSELKRRDKVMADLEKRYPGITKVPANGIFKITTDDSE